MVLHAATLAFVFGLLGNAISFMVFLAPVPTFYQIYKKKTTEGYQLSTVKMILLLNVFGFGAMLLSTYYLTTGSKRLHVIGWISLVFNIGVFAAPLSSLRRVIKTKSVEFMPINLSFFLTLNSVMWFFYGYLHNDYFVALPNILGFVFGIIQMVLYMMYRNNKKVILEDPMKAQEQTNDDNNNNDGHIIDVVKLGTMTPSSSNTNHESLDAIVNVTTLDDNEGPNGRK